jgi:hypothetical protein
MNEKGDIEHVGADRKVQKEAKNKWRKEQDSKVRVTHFTSSSRTGI